MPSSAFHDRDLRREQVQSPSSADAIAAFFAFLGHPDDARRPMTAEALGLSSYTTSVIQDPDMSAETDDIGAVEPCPEGSR